MSTASTIAIDGYAGSGKSTVGQRLANELGYLYFDTGVMYRAVTWAALDRGIAPDDEEAVSALAERLVIEVKPAPTDDTWQYTVLADGQDVTRQLRQPDVEEYVSLVSSYRRVRIALTEQQRRIAAGGEIVMIGRDIGTVVLPGADLKIFMRASVEERAQRRYKQAKEQEQSADLQEIREAIIARDKRDLEKPISPMVPADDAIILDTDHLSIEEVLSQVKSLAENCLST